MEILSVSLQNFKSHQELYLEFEPGSNAICGENGAGKTSVLEAIAWVLFNYCQYQREELIRKGAKSSQVIVQLISNQDGRTYQIKRCTRKGYELYDPQIDCKLEPTKVNDVIFWLKDHLGVPKDTDLPNLFSETIGIPQGTFTSDFLKNEGDRKKVFDPILRVEEYKKAYKDSVVLEQFSAAEVTTCEQHLDRYEVQLQDWDDLKKRHQDMMADIEQSENEKNTIVQRLNNLETRQQKLNFHQQTVDKLTKNLQHLEREIQGLQQDQFHLQKGYEQAQTSFKYCQENQASYQAYQQAEIKLGELKEYRQKQQELLRKREQQLRQIQEQQGQLTKLAVQRENCQVAQEKIEQLFSLREEQEELEKQGEEVEAQRQQVRDWKWKQEKTEKALYNGLRRLNELKKETDRLQKLESLIAQIPQLEQQYQRYQEQLSRVEAAQQFTDQIQKLVDRSEQHQGYYQQLAAFLPSLNLPNLPVQQLIEAGETCQEQILEILYQIQSDLEQKVSATKLQKNCDDLKIQLETAYQCRAEFSHLDGKRREELQLKQEADEWRSQLMELEQNIDREDELNAQLQRIGDRLQALQNPRGQIQIFQQQLTNAPQIEQQWQTISARQTQLQDVIAHLEQQLTEFSTLDIQIETQEQIKRDNADGYLVYLQSKKEAETLGDRQQKLEQTIAKLQQLDYEKDQINTELNNLSQVYSLDELQSLQQEYQTLSNRLTQLETLLSSNRKQLTDICQTLVKKGEIAQKRDRTLEELEKAKQNLQFIKDARYFFNQASPRITKFYLGEISQEADSIFRELMNRQNVALQWTEDYDIIVQEDGYKRNFKSLSGGEQMCAALAVRLSLLRTFADLDIAFFDEPTTNMDRPRRQQLAEAIGNLKSFRQLFVISHDDTFENMSNLIHLQRS